MKYCKYCGEELNNDAVFCTRCGKSYLEECCEQQVSTKKPFTGLSLGIISICTFYIPVVSLIFALVGLFFGTKTNKTSSIICSVIGFILNILILSLIILICVLAVTIYLIGEIGPSIH